MESPNLKEEQHHHQHRDEDPDSSYGCGCFRAFRFKPLGLVGGNDGEAAKRHGLRETTASWAGKVREFSEVVAGPKWKNFVRKVGGYCKGTKKHDKARFHYDPQSYALNFDSGHGREGEQSGLLLH